ncbi:MAG: NPCBM/NEW2 domain-containing protein [Bacteroidales bacterium]|nr:NPCBM/NEW2 domain-containing protein [Bacteroidales bacterium]
MKRFAILLLTLLVSFSAEAQVYLSKNYTPVEKRKYNPTYPGVRNEEAYFGLAGFVYTNGFKLRNGVLNDQAKEWAYAVFSLKGQYEKISFVVGYVRGNGWGSEKDNEPRFSAGDDGTHIVTIKADGRRIFDEVIREWNAPKEVVLDISGVDELRFDHLKGLETIGFAEVKLWKKGQTPTPAPNPLAKVITKDKVNLVDDIQPHFLCHRGWSVPVTVKHNWQGVGTTESVKMNRIEYNSGFIFSASQEFGKGISQGFAYFWLQKQYDKISFLIGPRDANSRNAKGWFTVKVDGKIIYEKLITQEDLVEQVVLDVKGANVVSMHSGELEQSDFLGGLDFGVVNIYAYKQGYAGVPTPGIANTAKEKISKFKDATRLCSSLEPYSVRGKAKYDDIYFNGASSYYHFSMGGEQFDEGFILATGESFMNGTISAYVEYDLAGEFDWLSFTVGTLSKHRVLGEDRLQIYADGALILDVDVHCLWPNQKFTIPINKCRRLKFTKPGTGGDKQTYIGVGDVMVFRGQPQDTDGFFYHPKPESPDEVDLIDYTKGPYFHYVGRYLSSLTNFDFNDCFKNGSSIKEAFTMKDGTRINKGIMLETNVPPMLAFEDIDLNTAIFLFVVGAGSSISASNVSAATGISAGAGLAGAMAAGYGALNLVGDKGHQSAYAAFNPFGEYESLKFTVANKSEYVDTDAFGAKLDPNNPVQLMVFADMRKVGEFTLTNKMQPATFEVPINKCTQLVFWLQCGDCRSGQYVLYDMTLSRKQVAMPAPNSAPTSKPAVTPALGNQDAASGKGKGKGKSKKEAAPVNWDFDGSRSRNDAIDTYLSDITAVWNEVKELEAGIGAGYQVKQDFVRTMAGDVYKCVSFVDKGGNRLSTTDIQKKIIEDIGAAKQIPNKVTLARIGQPSAALGLLNLQSTEAMSKYGKYVKTGKDALTQCANRSKEIVELKNMELEAVQSYIKKAINVGDKKSTAHVMILPLEPGEQPAPGTNMQMLEYYRF